MKTATQTYANLSSAKRGAKRKGVDLNTVEFYKTEDGRYAWRAKEEKAETKTVQPKTKPAPASTESKFVLPKPTVRHQGRLPERWDSTAKKRVMTKAEICRKHIADLYDPEANNYDEVIRFLMQELNMTRGLARVYFANNVRKVFEQLASV